MLKATFNTYLSGEFKESKGCKNEVHIDWNCRIKTVRIAGLANGKITVLKICMWVAPSITAASSRSTGMDRKNDVRVKMLPALTRPGKINDQKVLIN